MAGEAGESGTFIWGKREPWKLAPFVPVSVLLALHFPILYIHVLLQVIFCSLDVDSLFAGRIPCVFLGEIQPRTRLGLGEISTLHQLWVRQTDTDGWC